MDKIVKLEEKILEYLSDIYIFVLLLIFPLIVNSTGFFKILECKWYFFLNTSLMYIFLNIIIIIYFLIFKNTNILKKIKLNIIQIIAIILLLVNILSTILSPYINKYNLLIGIGRGEGLLMTSLYIITFLLVSFFTKFKKKYLIYFSISSILLNIIAILQYVGFNPFNMYQNGIGTHNVSFMGTIGNIDFISALYCILLTISLGSFIFLEDNSKLEKLIHLLSILMGFFIFGIINVESGKVAFLSIFIITLPFIISNNKRLSRFLLVIVTILMSYCINIILNPVFYYDIYKIKLVFQFNFIVVSFLIICSFLLFLSININKLNYDFSKNKKLLKSIYIIIILSLLLGIIFIYCFSFNSGILHEIHELLHGNFDDEFGSYRIFLWKRTLKIIPQYPILGTGPDTFVVRFMEKYTNDIMKIGPLTLNDTSANVYLTIMVNTGIIGLITYLSFIFKQIESGIKKANSYSLVLLITIICYLVQDFFNLSVVIVSPIFWLLMGIHFSSLKEQNKHISFKN